MGGGLYSHPTNESVPENIIDHVVQNLQRFFFFFVKYIGHSGLQGRFSSTWYPYKMEVTYGHFLFS